MKTFRGRKKRWWTVKNERSEGQGDIGRTKHSTENGHKPRWMFWKSGSEDLDDENTTWQTEQIPEHWQFSRKSFLHNGENNARKVRPQKRCVLESRDTSRWVDEHHFLRCCQGAMFEVTATKARLSLYSAARSCFEAQILFFSFKRINHQQHQTSTSQEPPKQAYLSQTYFNIFSIWKNLRMREAPHSLHFYPLPRNAMRIPSLEDHCLGNIGMGLRLYTHAQ